LSETERSARPILTISVAISANAPVGLCRFAAAQ
jgi:hypothetical protein